MPTPSTTQLGMAVAAASDSIRMPATFRSPRSTSFGHLHQTSWPGWATRAMASQIASDATKPNWSAVSTGHSGRRISEQ